jgi:hypothetical protein
MELGFLYVMMMKRVKTTAIIEVVHNIFTSLYVASYTISKNASLKYCTHPYVHLYTQYSTFTIM